MQQQRKPRGPSAANKRAEAYFKRHPDTSRRELAEKFELAPTTISRATWWKHRHAAMLTLDGNPIKPQICALCGHKRGNHKAKTLHCPLSRHQFTAFHKTQTYTEQSNNNQTGE